jgi:hypothetical protein
MAELFLAKGELEKALEFARGAVDILTESEDEWAKQSARETLRTVEEATAKRGANA